MSGPMKDPVDATLTVVSYQSTQFVNEFDETVNAQCVVEGKDLPATSVELKLSFPKTELPIPSGTAYEVTIDKSNLKNVKFHQEDEQQSASDGLAQANQLAEQMRSGATPGATGFAQNVQVVGAASPEQAKQAMAAAEQALGVDLDGDGQVAGKGGSAPAAGAAAPASGDDAVDKLARLAKLHEDGALTDAEFAAEKKKVLG